jgi:hypothetical protein
VLKKDTPRNVVLFGDVLDRLRELPTRSVHCVVTSPPYWGLRDYGTAEWIGGDPECDHLLNESNGSLIDGRLSRLDGVLPMELAL